MKLSEIRKAVVGAVVPAASVAVAALTNDGAIDTVEWIIIGVAFLTGGGVVWAIPNGAGVPRVRRTGQ